MLLVSSLVCYSRSATLTWSVATTWDKTLRKPVGMTYLEDSDDEDYGGKKMTNKLVAAKKAPAIATRASTKATVKSTVKSTTTRTAVTGENIVNFSRSVADW